MLGRWERGFVVGGGVLYLGLMGVVWGEGPVGFDGGVLLGLSELRTVGRTAAVLVVTDLGGWWVLTPLTVASAIVAAFASRRWAVFFAGAVGGAVLLNAGMKRLVERARPEVVEPVYQAAGYAFPSGHSMVSLAYFLAAALVVRAVRPKLTWVAAGVAFAAIAAIGLSRVYLGVHYPTDVIGGWALGSAWVLVVFGLCRTPKREPH